MDTVRICVITQLTLSVLAKFRSWLQICILIVTTYRDNIHSRQETNIQVNVFLPQICFYSIHSGHVNQIQPVPAKIILITDKSRLPVTLGTRQCHDILIYYTLPGSQKCSMLIKITSPHKQEMEVQSICQSHKQNYLLSVFQYKTRLPT